MTLQAFDASGLALLATIVLIFPMFYFAFASLTFFLRPLADPIVGRMLRGLFHASFLAMGGLGALAGLAFMATRQHAVAAGLGLLAACTLASRTLWLRRIDAVLRAPGPGTPGQLRRLQWAGMAYNACQLLILLPSLPRLFPIR